MSQTKQRLWKAFYEVFDSNLLRHSRLVRQRGVGFLIGCSLLYKRHIVDDGYINEAFLRAAAELLVTGSNICRSRWRAALCQRPWLTTPRRLRCGVRGGFWRQKRLFCFGMRHMRFCEETPECHISAAPLCGLREGIVPCKPRDAGTSHKPLYASQVQPWPGLENGGMQQVNMKVQWI